MSSSDTSEDEGPPKPNINIRLNEALLENIGATWIDQGITAEANSSAKRYVMKSDTLNLRDRAGRKSPGSSTPAEQARANRSRVRRSSVAAACFYETEKKEQVWPREQRNESLTTS